MNKYHTSVLLQQALDALNVQDGKHYIDATLGGGGHTRFILERGGNVLGIDVDTDALEFVKQNFQDSITNSQLKLVRGNFREIDRIARENGFENVAGIIFDLGVSSYQVDTAGRGFSFQKDGPLDMRMDQTLTVRAENLINLLPKGELYKLFTDLGEERFSYSIVDAIVKARRIKAIITTAQLAEIVKNAVPRQQPGFHPATRIFQALRMTVNDEQDSLKEALPKAVHLLTSGGRLVIISFHSLEDRIVKLLFKTFAEKGIGKIVTKKPITPASEEIVQNNRSRSAKMRVFEKI